MMIAAGMEDGINVEITQDDVDLVMGLPEVKALLEKAAMIRVLKEQAQEIERLTENATRPPSS